MIHPTRLTTAFFVAPLATPLVLWLGELVLDFPGRAAAGLVGSLLINFAFALPAAYLAELVLGIPAWKAFVKFHVASPIAFLAAGALIGLIPALLLPGAKAGAIALCALAGAVSALLFHVMVHERDTCPAA